MAPAPTSSSWGRPVRLLHLEMFKVLLVTLIPVSGCVTGYVRDTERGIWPGAYDQPYYVAGWKEKFIVKPSPVQWREP